MPSCERWKRALLALLDLNTTYGWRSKQRRKKILAVAQDPWIVGAVQAVAVGCQSASLDMLAVLCAEASGASIDALLPHFDNAERTDERLPWLLKLRTHASDNASIQRLFHRLEAQHKALRSRSPALALRSASVSSSSSGFTPRSSRCGSTPTTCRAFRVAFASTAGSRSGSACGCRA